MTAPVLMNHAAGSRSPAELTPGEEEEEVGLVPTMAHERRRGALEVLQARDINQSRSHHNYSQGVVF